MSEQAKNSLELYKDCDPRMIEQALLRQSESVVNELKSHFGVSDIKALAGKLSIGEV